MPLARIQNKNDSLSKKKKKKKKEKKEWGKKKFHAHGGNSGPEKAWVHGD